jgi:hypothetical protein
MSVPSIKPRVKESIRACGADYERLEHRRELERLRKRKARKRQTSEQLERERGRKREARKQQTLEEREHEHERKREARLQRTAEQREREKERNARRNRTRLRPFMAIDGEGGGTDELGRQNYFLMVASGQTPGEQRILDRDGKPLSTRDCLEFILSLPPDPILVGYGVGYDSTQILRGIKPPTLRQILYPRQGKNGPCYTYWGDYAIAYQQGQYFRAARIDRSGPKPDIVKGSCRTIYETLGFFQCSFVKAIENWGIGDEEERAIIAANKMQRDVFLQLTDAIIGYCKLECRYLATLMSEFREVCATAGILPKQWSGAGWLASALLDKHGIPKRPLTHREVTALGERKPPDGPWCGFPFRQRGNLFWPLQGTGWYWSPEIEAARLHLRADIILRDLWVVRQECNCQPFKWVGDLYEERRRLGSDTRGYPLKIGLASLYGKMAQRCGRGPYHDVVSAGLITAITRARLTEALGKGPDSVVMQATDAVLITRRLSLDVGEKLGQWEEKVWPDLFIAQPGVYWSPSDLQKSVKSRGAPRSVIGPAASRFHEVFDEWLRLLRQSGAMGRVLEERLIPSVPIAVRVFNGCRLAIARGKPWLAGRWEDVTRHESFEWKTKRDAMRIRISDEGYLVTFPPALSIFAESEGYKPADFDRHIEISGETGGAEEIDENMLLEAMPDFIPFLPRE